MKKIIFIFLLTIIGSQTLALGPTQQKALRTGLTGMKTLIDKILEKLDNPAKSSALTPTLVICGLFEELLFDPTASVFDTAAGLYPKGNPTAQKILLGKALLGAFKSDINGALNCPVNPVDALEDF